MPAVKLIPPSPLRAAALAVLVMAGAGGPPLLAQSDRGFFRAADVDFWQAGPATAAPAESLFPEAGRMPEPVRRLVEDPNDENAKSYLLWQRERTRRMALALKALRQARASEPPALLFSKPDCPYCIEQERILRLLPLRIVRLTPDQRPDLWAKHRITAVPTTVIGGRAFRGLTDLPTLARRSG